MYVGYAGTFMIQPMAIRTMGLNPGTRFEDLPDDWSCPVCGATKDKFEQE